MSKDLPSNLVPPYFFFYFFRGKPTNREKRSEPFIGPIFFESFFLFMLISGL